MMYYIAMTVSTIENTLRYQSYFSRQTEDACRYTKVIDVVVSEIAVKVSQAGEGMMKKITYGPS